MQPTLAELQPILAGIGQAPVAAITTLKDEFSQVYRLDLADGASLILKSFVMENVSARKDAYAAGLVASLDVPVTRYLLVDESMTRLPFSFALTSYLEGEPATTFATHPRYPAVMKQLGALSRRLHAIRVPTFGELPAPVYTSNADYIRGLADGAFERFSHYGAEPILIAKLRQIFDRDFDAVVPASTVAAFAHDDLQPNNFLVTETDGELTISGLIDYGNARASAGVMDLAKTLFCCEHMTPGCTAAILSGYGPIDHPEPERALAFYTLLHRIIMWWWLRHIGVLPTPEARNDIIPALRQIAASA